MRVRSPRPIVVDTLIALVCLWIAFRRGQESVAHGWPRLDAGAWACLAVAYLPLALRRQAPVAVFVVVQAASAIYIGAGYWPVITTLAPMLALYTVASMRPARTAVICAATMTAVWVYAGAFRNDGRGLGTALPQAVLFCSALIWFGTVARRADQQAAQLRLEQAERARHEVSEERGRIARELHDVVAHHMAVVSVQAGLARFVFDSDARTARLALDTIQDASSEALEELRRMLQVLREPDLATDDSGTPMPTLAGLDDLIERVRAGGVPVELSIQGRVRPLAPGVELCAYRVVQEALTNVLKHTTHAGTLVQLDYRRHELMVSITDDGDPAAGDRPPAGGGHGLLGMRERARIYGGSISVGPRAEGGFRVCLTLPTTTAALIR